MAECKIDADQCIAGQVCEIKQEGSPAWLCEQRMRTEDECMIWPEGCVSPDINAFPISNMQILLNNKNYINFTQITLRWLCIVLLIFLTIVAPVKNLAAQFPVLDEFIGNVLYPGKKIGKTIDDLEDAISNVIDNAAHQYDASMVRTLQSVLDFLQQARIIYRDEINFTFDRLDQTQRVFFSDLKNTLDQVNNLLGVQFEELRMTLHPINENIAGLSDALLRLPGADRKPFIRENGPKLIFPDALEPVNFWFDGVHLTDAANGLQIGEQYFPPDDNISPLKFEIPAQLVYNALQQRVPILLHIFNDEKFLFIFSQRKHYQFNVRPRYLDGNAGEITLHMIKQCEIEKREEFLPDLIVRVDNRDRHCPSSALFRRETLEEITRRLDEFDSAERDRNFWREASREHFDANRYEARAAFERSRTAGRALDDWFRLVPHCFSSPNLTRCLIATDGWQFDKKSRAELRESTVEGTINNERRVERIGSVAPSVEFNDDSTELCLQLPMPPDWITGVGISGKGTDQRIVVRILPKLVLVRSRKPEPLEPVRHLVPWRAITRLLIPDGAVVERIEFLEGTGQRFEVKLEELRRDALGSRVSVNVDESEVVIRPQPKAILN